ncbi:aminoglycoside phosphotransferase family protein [Haloprofundus salilacus]|uniref:aminoglycoside phosphotransferase family protein n=1 Tax=Haloprofundus salilacus TaxID=2876190 RepID=UPI001CCF8931|nr:aminoglycoside phosphotransferase family protein [Haloprofundus salilacus]
MIGHLLDAVAERFDADRSALSYSLYSGTRGPTGYITVFVHERDEPIAVCRFARWDDDEVRGEWERLTRLQAVVGETDWLRTSVETPVAVETIDGTPVIFKQYLGGWPAHYTFRRFDRCAKRFLSNATEWLIEFVQETADYRTYDSDAKRQRLRESVLPEAKAYARRYVDADDLFLGPVHGDYDGTNILLGPKLEVTSVIDFEYFRVDGVPLVDLLKLVVETGLYVFGSYTEATNRAFFRDCDFSRTVGRCVSAYCSNLGIDEERFVRVLPLYPALRLGPTPKRDHTPWNLRFYRHLYDALSLTDAIVWSEASGR